MKRMGLSCLVLCLLPAIVHADIHWTTLETGLEYARYFVSHDGEGEPAHILRIDPDHWRFRLLSKKEYGAPRTAAKWAEQFGLVAAVNAGMYQEDYVSNVGYMRGPETDNNPHVNAYKSAFAFASREGRAAPRLYDLDVTPFNEITDRYEGIIQNLRLIKRPGENRWARQERRWSEVALAQDDQGRLLFLFLHTPMTMHAFNARLLQSPLGIVAAQHLEGGPEASLSIRHPELTIDLFGSYETNLDDHELLRSPWAIPNVLGIVRKP